MPGFEIGGIDVTVEPSFRGFREKTREQLAEEERHATFEVKAEPRLTPGFKRELTKLVREASAGVSFDIEAKPALASGYRKELTRLVREASAGVKMSIEATPNLATGFRKQLTEMVQRSAAGIALQIEAKPVLAAGFRRELRAELQRLTAGEKVEVEVTSQLKEGFRRGLNEQVQRSVRGLKATVEATPKLATGFKKTLAEQLKKGKATTFFVYAEPRLAPGFRANLRKLATSKTAAFPVTVEVNAEAPRDIRTKLILAIKKATELPPLVARVKIEPEIGDLRARTQAAVRQVSAQAKLRPGVDSNTLRHRLISDVTQMMAAANRIAKLNVVATIRTIGGKGLSAVESSLRAISRVGRATVIGLAAVAGAIGGVGTAGLKSASDLEATRKSFEIQLRSVQKGTDVFNALVQAAKGTTFEVPDLSKVVQQLLQVDRLSKVIDFGDIIPTLTQLTDFGSALNLAPAAMERIALALTKIAGRGKLTGEELRSISKNAPQLNAIGLIAKDLGVTVPEAFDAIRAGAVSSDQAIRVLLTGIKNFPGAAGAGLKLVTQTFKGALSNLPDILRLSFFQALEGQLPELTRIIGPEGPLISAFTAAVPALAKALVPLASTVLQGVSDFAEALSSAAEAVVPIFTQLGRATEAIGLQMRRLFDNMGPGLRDLAKSFATLLAGISPVLPLIGDFVSLAANQLSQVIDSLVSGGAVDIVTELFQGLHDALAELLPIVGSVAKEVGGALLKALHEIDLDQLGKALGDLVTAGGDLLVALAPLIPELVKIAAIFAESLAPAVEASIPLIEAVTKIITPLAEGLARLGPTVIILGLVLKGALALGQGVATITKFVAALENLKRTRVEVFQTPEGGQDKLIRFDGQQVIGALRLVASAAAVTAAAMSSYFAAASSDIVTQIGGISASLTSIAVAFAVGGPIAGAVAAIGAGIGVVLGSLSRRSAEVRKEAEETQKFVDQIQQSFKTTGVASQGAKIIGTVDAIAKAVDAGSAGAKQFTDGFQADLQKVAVLLLTNKKAYSDYVHLLEDQAVSRIFQGDIKTINQFRDGVKLATDQLGLSVDTMRLVAGESKINHDALIRLSDAFLRGGLSGDELASKLHKLGLTGGEVEKVMDQLRHGVAVAVAQSAAAKFGFTLDDSVLKAIRQQEQLARVEEALKTDNDRLSDSFSGFQTATNAATQALQHFRDASEGDAQSARDSILNSIETAKQLTDLQKQQKEGTISAAEAELRRQQIISQAADQNSAVVGRMLVEANGNYEKFRQSTDKLRRDTIAQLQKALGLSAEDAAKLADKLLDIPDRKEFKYTSNLPETRQEAEKLDAALDHLNARKMKKIILDLQANMTTVDLEGNVHKARVVGFSAEGKLALRPELSWIGEAGPELVLPLRDKKRMQELILQAQRAGLLDVQSLMPAAPTVGLPGTRVAAGPALGLNVKPAIDEKGGKDFTDKAGQVISDLGDKMTKATDPGLGRWQDKVGAHLDSVHAKLGTFGTKAVASMTKTTGDLTSIATSGSASVVGALRTGLNTGTTTIGTIVRGYARTLATSLNPVLGAIGQPKIDVSKFRKGGVRDPRIAEDGSYQVHVFGERGTRGEAYIPFDPSLRSRSRMIADETVKRLGGQATWFRGGGVSGDTQGLNPEFLRRLERWSYRVGTGYTVDSGLRSLDEQRRLYQRYIAGVPGQAKAALPGSSMHNFGLASDGNRWGSLRPGDFGLVYRVPGEPWHIEPLEARTWAKQGMADAVTISPIAQPPGVGKTGALGIVAKKAMDFSYEQALGWAARQIITAPGGNIAFSGSSANRAGAERAARLAIALTGVPGSWLGPLMTLFGRESGYDPLAINLWDSNARAGHPSKGLGQMIESTFLAHALPGHTNIFAALDNAAAVIRYILDRYGDIFHVQQANANLPPRGYENGSIVYREEVARVAERNRPEVIIPLTKPARARELAQQSGLTRMLDGGGYRGPKTVIEGGVNVTVQPPDAHEPDAYAASMTNRMGPAIRSAVEAAVG